MSDHLEIVSDVEKANEKPEYAKLPVLNPEYENDVSTTSKGASMIALRRFRVKALLNNGCAISEILKRMRISEKTLYRDLVQMGREIHEKEDAGAFILALATQRYESKRASVVKEIEMSKNPWIHFRGIELLDQMDKNWHDFVFKFGLVKSVAAPEDKTINVRFCTTDADLAELAARAKRNAINVTSEQANDVVSPCE